MTADHMNRVPAGISTGGQFSGTVHREAVVKLFDRNDGSFLHPSPSATADHCISFWENIEIPDEIIDQFESAYFGRKVAEIDTEVSNRMEIFRQQWLEENPEPRRQKDTDAWKSKYNEDFAARSDQVREEVSADAGPSLYSYDVRQLVRAHKMALNRPDNDRFPGEGEAVLEHRVELFEGTKTVREIEFEYRMFDLQESMNKINPDDTAKEIKEGFRYLGNHLHDVKLEVRNQRRDLGYEG